MNQPIRISQGWQWWMRLLALGFCGGLSWLVWRKGENSLGAWVAQLLAVCGLYVAAVSGETVIDPQRQQVRREWKLFGVVPLHARTYLPGDFREVRWRRRWIESEADSQHYVELVLRSGRALILKTFVSLERDRSCGDANALALEISDCLHLPFTREPEAAS
jgi:hypothetical protein